METDKRSSRYTYLKIWKRIRHGLFLFSLRNFLSRFGLDIRPYYWFKEERDGSDVPEIKDNKSAYTMSLIGIDEVGVMNGIMGLNTENLINSLNKGQFCIGLKKGKEIASLLFVDPNDFEFMKRPFQLESGTGYLLNVYTFQKYRGKNLATYLRYHCFKLLEDKRIHTLYSITSYFNTSSLKVNAKLNAKKIRLYLYLGLFKKWHWNVLLKEYT